MIAKDIHLPDRSPFFGAALIFTASLLFSSKAVIVKLAYRYEIDSASLLALRMLFALPVYLGIAFWILKRTNRTDPYGKAGPRDLLNTVLLGIFGFYLASYLDFAGLQYIMASLERLILFIYPTVVVFLSAVFFKQRISRNQLLALGVTYVGIVIAFWENLRLSGDREFFLGIALVLCSAVIFAMYMVGSGRVIPRVGSVKYNSIAMIAAAMAVLIHHALVHQLKLFHFPPAVYGLSILMALVATVLPSFMVSEGIRLIGASNVSIISSVGPISTNILAFIFLDEILGPWQWTGTFLVIGGVLLISRQ